MRTRQEAWILFGRKEQMTVQGIAPYIILATRYAHEDDVQIVVDVLPDAPRRLLVR